ncbi:Transmembrane domain-containing protein [Spironucleus salmonicida]|uniref:Transmembrane domain-containing protein n=1 Tax=Spironucleus salmonicida TaxID=348837 RepID=V6M5S3_9EUKA|nr:Transmembrane domain-containing protein [Spironucleus salmonicida]|eukprot:EST48684.1 Transmembrane domain-containing protein [Spironucleus salmonicida]
MTIVDVFYVRNFNWPARIRHNWKMVVQIRCFVSFLSLALGLYSMQCIDMVFGQIVTTSERILLIITIILWAIDPIICFFALPSTWLNYVVLGLRIYTGIFFQLRQFLNSRYQVIVSINANFALEVLILLWQMGDFVFIYQKPLQ